MNHCERVKGSFVKNAQKSINNNLYFPTNVSG